MSEEFDAAEICRELGLPAESRDAVDALVGIGVSPEAIARAAGRGRIEDAIFDAVLSTDRERRSVSASDIEARGGWPAEATLQMIHAFGFPSPAPDETYFSPEEADALIAAAERKEWWPVEVQFEISRVWGQALARIAAAEIYNFRHGTAASVRSAGAPPAETLATIQRALAELLPLADPLLLGIHRRWVDYELTQYAVREAESRAEGAIPGATEVCLLFCDLKDFTAYGELHGDGAAMAAASRFSRATFDHRGPGGQVVKGLGDGAMLVYEDTAGAVEAWRRLCEAMDDPEMPALHGAVHRGEILRFEGDYFGGAVNLTARLLALSGSGELLATGAAVASAGPDCEWKSLGRRTLRGFREPVEIHRLAS
ncbi:MAG: adenylate/guanylate cyclase domain-containing protein [Solirubrobacterales bacterium]